MIFILDNEKLVTKIPSLRQEEEIDCTENNQNNDKNNINKKVRIEEDYNDFESANYINDSDSEENEAEHEAEKYNEFNNDDENENNNENNEYPFSYTLNADFSKWYRKPYLGGYRNKITKVEYFHASTQTTTPQEKRAMVIF